MSSVHLVSKAVSCAPNVVCHPPVSHGSPVGTKTAHLSVFTVTIQIRGHLRQILDRLLQLFAIRLE